MYRIIFVAVAACTAVQAESLIPCKNDTSCRPQGIPSLENLAFSQSPPKIIREQSGNVVNFRTEGNLAPTHPTGCIPLAKIKNTLTPADLLQGVAECIAQNNYDDAIRMFVLAGIYARFDAERIRDKTAGQAKTVLILNLFSSVPQTKKTRFRETAEQITKSPEALGVICGEVQKIGMPAYYPDYMILHGIKAFTGQDGALVKDFDAPGAWQRLQSAYLHCPN